MGSMIITMKEKVMKEELREIPVVEKIINLKVLILGSVNLFFTSQFGPRCVR